MKKCSKCKHEKELTEFSKDNRSSTGYRTNCKECQRAYAKTAYKNNPTIRIISNMRNDKIRKRNRVFVFKYLINSKCVDCGDTRWQVLDFDHVRGTKHNNISNMVHNGSSIKKLQEEIEKCEVRCANCHRIKTSEQLEYYPYLKDTNHPSTA
jgi:hypothetical protein